MLVRIGPAVVPGVFVDDGLYRWVLCADSCTAGFPAVAGWVIVRSRASCDDSWVSARSRSRVWCHDVLRKWSYGAGGGAVLRAVAAGVSFVVAAVSGVVTSLVTAHSSRGLWVALGVLVVAGAGLQVAVSMNERGTRGRVAASGAGSVAVGGSAGTVTTWVAGAREPAGAPGEDGVTASGPGAVGVGGDVAGPVSTHVTEADGQG